MTPELYFRFRRWAVPDGAILGLMVFDLSAQPTMHEASALELRTGGAIVGTTRPFDAATYPDFLHQSRVRPTAYLETRYEPAANTTRSVQVYECIDDSGVPVSEAAIFAVPTTLTLPVPEEANIIRVAGKMNAYGFLVGGASWYAAFAALIERELGPITNSARILDWGVGSGRIARYFLEDGFENVQGVDIDAVNIAWCADNLSGGKFERCDFDPPLAYDDSSFDLVYGHSVFSHLDASAEKAWLRELNRVLAPGGLACVTVNTEYTARLALSHLLEADPTIMATLMAQGGYDLGPQQVGVDEGREGYYRLTLRTRGYLRREWAKHVDLVRIIPGFAESQDGVVFRKRLLPGEGEGVKGARGGIARTPPHETGARSDWRWEGDDPAELYVVGQSHRAALVAALRIPHLRPSFPVAALHGADGARQDPDDDYWDIACGLPGGTMVAVVWNGNQHNASFLLTPTMAFTLASVPEAPGVVVPVELVRSFFRPTFEGLEQLLGRIGDSLRVIVAGTPPPKSDAIVRENMEIEPVLRKLIVDGGFRPATAPLTPGPLRVALWQIVQDLLRDIAAAHGAFFVPVPPEAIAEDGHLRDELSAQDATHANERYGALMLRAIADVVVKANAE
jgi:SAM-dependent methyltransferase